MITSAVIELHFLCAKALFLKRSSGLKSESLGSSSRRFKSIDS